MLEFEQLKEDSSSLPETAQSLVVDFVSFLKQRYTQSEDITPRPLDLQNQPFVEIWSDRPDMQDSTAWVRLVRQQHWRN
ncbi:MAG: hypothetical protein IGR76_11295 [Synechococcales cyanobacterium T60_A2020_003]|nr:hypothetical protein [Synechococcales cyanobacterium T60_A2020_003]